MLVLMLMGNMVPHLVDVNGTFLFCKFKPEEKNYMKIPCGFEIFYADSGLWFLKCTLHSVKNTAKAFWQLLLGIMNELGCASN